MAQPCRLGRADAAALINRELMRLGHLGVVCKAFASMGRMGHNDAIASVALELARQGSPGAIAKAPALTNLLFRLIFCPAGSYSGGC